jgi:hypothetical protein
LIETARLAVRGSHENRVTTQNRLHRHDGVGCGPAARPLNHASIGVGAEQVTDRAAYKEPSVAKLDKNRRDIAGGFDSAVALGIKQRLALPEDGAVGFVERDQKRVASAGSDIDSAVIDEETFTEAPGDVLTVELFERVERPQFDAAGSVQAGEPTSSILMVKPPSVIRDRRAGTRIRPQPGQAIGRAPERLAGEIEGEQMHLRVSIPGNEEVISDDDG